MGGRVRSRRYGGFRRSGLNLLFYGFTSRFPWFYLAVSVVLPRGFRGPKILESFILRYLEFKASIL